MYLVVDKPSCWPKLVFEVFVLQSVGRVEQFEGIVVKVAFAEAVDVVIAGE